MEIAALGLRVDGVENIGGAASALDRFAKNADKADSSASGLTKALAGAGKASDNVGSRMAKAGQQAVTGSSGVDKFKQSLLGAQASAVSLKGALAGAFLGVSIAGAFAKVIRETQNFEKEQAQLSAVLKSTGNAAGFSRDQLNEMAGAMSSASVVTGGEIGQAQTTLLAFTGIVGEEFTDALQAAIDMSARTGMSVVSAAETIGRALDVPSQGLTALSRQGFRFSEEQKKLAERLESTGKTAEAQGIILGALKESYGGAAAAARDTFGGAVTGLQNTISDLLTGGDGSLDEAKSAINDLSTTLASEETKKAFADFVSLVTGATNALVKFAAASRNGWPGMLANLEATAFKSSDATGEIAALRQEIEKMEESAKRSGGINSWIFDKGIDYRKGRIAALEDQIRAADKALFNPFLGVPETGEGIPQLPAIPVRPTGTGKPPKTPKGSTSELANLVKQLQLQQATLGMTTEQAERYRIATAAGSEADRKRALTLYDQIQAWNETEKAMQAAIDSSRQYLAFQQEMDVFQQKLNLESAGVGMGDRQRELAQADLAIRQEYAQKRLDLEMAQQVKETALTQEQYQYRLDLFQQFEEQKLAGLQQSAEARAIAEADWTNGMSRAWENFATKAQDIASQTDALFTGMLDSMTRGFGNAFESMIFDSENLGDAMQKLGQNMLRSVVNALGQMAAQWLAYQAVQLFVGKTTQASSAMAISANAYATALQAGLAAFASTAAIPVVGPAAAPAAMGAALAVATPLATAVSMTAMAGMAHDGIDSVPQTGTWLLEKGERVTTAKTSARLDSVLERIDARQRAGSAFDGQPGSSSRSEPRVVVQLMGGEFQGAQVTEERGSTDEEMIVRVMSREFLQGGQSFDALQSVSNVRRVGA
ncbi:phage tail length tape measure family protein [Alcaligenes nematophilus]